MKLKDALDPDYQRKYDKACRDWKIGKNLWEAAGIVYSTTSKRRIAALVKQREADLATNRRRGEKLKICGLGALSHNGEAYVMRAAVFLYPKRRIEVRIPFRPQEPEVIEHIQHLWSRFQSREKTLLRELQTAVAKHYRFVVGRLSTAAKAVQAPLKRNADIWDSLGVPEVSFLRDDQVVGMQIRWSPEWEEEHGVYAYLDSNTKVRYVGQFGGE